MASAQTKCHGRGKGRTKATIVLQQDTWTVAAATRLNEAFRMRGGWKKHPTFPTLSLPVRTLRPRRRSRVFKEEMRGKGHAHWHVSSQTC